LIVAVIFASLLRKETGEKKTLPVIHNRELPAGFNLTITD